ncbi:MAG: Nif3-like dinuclear metal center hexameric protein [Oscillospiraceae bacterium]|nr:Nif3-like dinuclear metal center hexameric protein [Oscillospiraceae bacterium]
MAKVWQIEKALDALAPRDTALSYDNVGLLVGDRQAQTESAFLTLDITPEAVEEAHEKGISLIISHHPVIFQPFRQITPEKYDTEAARRLLKYDMAAICMHTNLDLARGGVNDALAEKLGLANIHPFAGDPDALLRIGDLPRPMSAQDFAAHVRRSLGASGVWFQDSGKIIRTAAVCGGAGGGDDEAALAIESRADVYVSSEFKHHITLQAAYRGLSLIDAGHFYTERPVLDKLRVYLAKEFPTLRLVLSVYKPGGKFIAE